MYMSSTRGGDSWQDLALSLSYEGSNIGLFPQCGEA